ncbi:MAG: hypothetical protein WCA38_09990 [Candidatus Acidiferrales bacterium]
MRRWVVLGLCTLVFAILVDFTSLAQDVAAAKIPQQAFAALGKARQWRSDAILVMVEVNDYGGAGNFTIKFSFYSPADRTGLWVIATAQGSSLVSEAGAVNWGTLAIPQLFLDLPEAVQKARALGMQGKMDHAMLRASSYGLNWEITPVSDPNLRVFTIKANLDASSSQPLQLPQLTQAPQLVSDWRIVPGQRIGPVSLGMTPASALRALGQLSQKCTVDILNARKGTDTMDVALNQSVTIGDPEDYPTIASNQLDPGQTNCNFDRWQLLVVFKGKLGSRLGDRMVTWIETPIQGGGVSGNYSTDRGIRIGSSEQDVLKAYGNVELKEDPFQAIKMAYSELGIEFTVGGSGPISEERFKNIVKEIAVTKAER